MIVNREECSAGEIMLGTNQPELNWLVWCLGKCYSYIAVSRFMEVTNIQKTVITGVRSIGWLVLNSVIYYKNCCCKTSTTGFLCCKNSPNSYEPQSIDKKIVMQTTG